ncbi:MAG: sigma-70 family RNA polymerase sigma factor [Myxococcota bacterium]
MTDAQSAGHYDPMGLALAEAASAEAASAEAASTKAAPTGAASTGPTRLEVSVLTFDEVYEQWFDFVWRSCRRLGVAESQVDDAVQDVFVVVHRRLQDFEGRSTIKTWLFGITLRVVKDHRRSERRRRKPEAEPLRDSLVDDRAAGPMENVARAEAVRTLHALLDGMDDERREVFVMMEFEQMSAPEVAAALGVKVNTVYSRLRLARQSFEEGIKRLRARDGWRQR